MRIFNLLPPGLWLLASLAAPASAQLAPTAAPLTCVAGDLPRHPLMAGNLKLTISRFSGDATYRNRYFQFQLANPTQHAVPFSFEDFMVVDAEGRQTPLLLQGWTDSDSGRPELRTASSSIRIAPGATLFQSCLLANDLKSPAKIYYGDQLLAVVSF